MDSATIPRPADLDWGDPGFGSYASGVDPNLQLFQEDLRPELILARSPADQVGMEWTEAVAGLPR